MEYVNKKCPICGKEFMVVASAAEKELGCTIRCLGKIQEIGKGGLAIENC